MELRLSVPHNCRSVQFDIGVSNVGDAAFQSEVIVDKAGDLDCEECGNCPRCKSDPMCSPTCRTRQPGTCSFYRDCMEESRPCADDPSSYALNYGEKNCLAYRNNLGSFSARGQSFVLGTMMCLQDALRPKINCDAQCANLRAIAFNSHPGCYVDNGFCYLTCGDYWQVLMTIGGELRTLEAMVSEMLRLRWVSTELCQRERTLDTQACEAQLSRNTFLVLRLQVFANAIHRGKSLKRREDAWHTSKRFSQTTTA